MALASYLARTVQARLILLSRSAPKAEQVSDLEQLGAQVLWVGVDVSDETQMRAAVQEARRKFGEINGVIHAAGVPGGGFIQLMRSEVAATTIAAKVKGTLVLEEALAGESLDFTILFSSLRSILGGHGRVDYCAANSFLDAFARAQATGDAPFTCSIIWDGWREVGMAVDAARRSNLEPEDGMLTEEGIEAFARVLDGRWPEIVVSTRDLGRIIEENKAITVAGRLDQLDDERTAQPAHSRPNIDTPYVAPQTETERTIAQIWQQLLGIEKVGVDDNFFELGGDSVLTIQIIAKTNKAGLRLTPQQVFEHQTIAALAAVAGTGEVVVARQDVVTGAVPLTPVQCWFTELATTDPHHWNQSLLLETRKPLDASLLKQALASVMAHHDALRMRFTIDESGWRQYNAAFDGQVPFAYHDLSMLPEKEQTATIEAEATEAQASLDLTTGLLLRVSFFDTGPGKPGRLLLIAHHLVMDAISLRFVLEDLATAYEQAARSEPISLPAKTTSFKTWAEMLVEHAQSVDVAGELEYWLAEERQGMFPLPIDVEDGRRLNTEESARTFRVALDVEETRALLQDVPHVYHTQINDVLMTGLALALRHWTDQRPLLVDVEGHGRDAIVKGTDVTRTVGWFTTIYPVLLELDEGWGVGEALKRIKEELRRLPGRGFSYGLLRYLHQDLKIRERLRQAPRAEVSFLYLGQLNEALPESTPFVPAAESRGPTVSPRATRSHLLMISGFVAGGRLQLDWTYSVNVHRAATVERLAESYLQSLRDIVRHCSEAEAGGFTPSDFPAAELSQEELDQLIQDLSRNHIGAGEAA
jgi:non-ribosomal peptide synthase protein (TIGR01720 family)